MEVRRLFDCLYYQLEQYPLEKSFAYKEGDQWKYYSTQDMLDMVNQTSAGMLKLGLKPGDKVAIAAYKNRPEWTVVDLASQQIGVVNVPVYPTISPGEYEYIFNDSGVSYAFVGGQDLYDKVANAQANVPTLKGIYTFDQQQGRPFWKEIWTTEGMEEVEKRKAAVQPDDLATIIYTSGTTGNPKGVMLSHNNILSIVLSTKDVVETEVGAPVLSFLPLCHVFERAISYSYMYKGSSVHYTGTDNLGGETGDLQTVKPHFFTTVPRLLEKVYEAIYNKGLELSGIKKKLFFWALSLTEDFEYDKQYKGWEAFKRKIADKLIFSKWRAALGGNVRGIISGAAPLQVKIAKVFSAAGIPIREGYGLTEASPTLTVNLFEPGGAMAGTVGPPIDIVEIKIDDSEGDYREGEGEILAKGPNIMMGYYNKPEANAQVFKIIDGERWLRTGDVGKLVDGPNGRKFLKITDRKKELLKTSGGKYVAPAPIENKFKESFLIEQMMVIGDNRKFVSALIVPAQEALKDWCKSNGVEWTSLSEVVKNPKVIAAYQEVVDQFNPLFSHIEQIKKFTLLDTTWEPTKADGSKAELTPTLKLKRRVILEKYADVIEAMYQ
ncbi:MAG: long-chain fatty acid--CoA ligase [Bacteroidetes bacterium]|nr:MAG: long-chain fatty acid--CoA ligase [Bacteroidota bacterium]